MNLLDAYHESSSLFSISITNLYSQSAIKGGLKHLDYSHRKGLLPDVLKQWSTRFPDLGKYQIGRNRASLAEMEVYQEFIKGINI